MKKDIESRADLEMLLTDFYRAATRDEKIGYFFTEVARLDIEAHLPVITNFWEKILFGAKAYYGNPFVVHQRLDEQAALNPEHFTRWVEIFQATVDQHFAGRTAQMAKMRAAAIAHNMSNALLRNRPQNDLTSVA